MIKFTLNIILIALPILVMLIAVNIIGDSARMLNHDKEKKIANLQNSCDFVSNLDLYNERVYNRLLINSCNEKKNIVVLGSSRVMQISEDYFPGSSLMNCGLSGASLEDVIALYQIIRNKGNIPDTIILGVEAWFFNDNQVKTKWKVISEYYNEFLKNEKETTVEYIQDNSWLISPVYFQSSINLIGAKAEPICVESSYNEKITLLNDNSIIYGKAVRNSSEIVVDNKVKSFNKQPVYRMSGFEEVSQDRWKEFVLLIEDMLKTGINVKVIMPPYHPDVYFKIKNKVQPLECLEKALENLLNKYNIPVLCRFNPNDNGFTKVDFFDAVHLRKKAVFKMIK